METRRQVIEKIIRSVEADPASLGNVDFPDDTLGIWELSGEYHPDFIGPRRPGLLEGVLNEPGWMHQLRENQHYAD